MFKLTGSSEFWRIAFFFCLYIPMGSVAGILKNLIFVQVWLCCLYLSTRLLRLFHNKHTETLQNKYTVQSYHSSLVHKYKINNKYTLYFSISFGSLRILEKISIMEKKMTALFNYKKPCQFKIFSLKKALKIYCQTKLRYKKWKIALKVFSWPYICLGFKMEGVSCMFIIILFRRRGWVERNKKSIIKTWENINT